MKCFYAWTVLYESWKTPNSCVLFVSRVLQVHEEMVLLQVSVYLDPTPPACRLDHHSKVCYHKVFMKVHFYYSFTNKEPKNTCFSSFRELLANIKWFHNLKNFCLKIKDMKEYRIYIVLQPGANPAARM